MIFLGKNDNIPNIYQPPVGQKLIRFNVKSDILPALTYVTTSKFNPEAKPFIPAAVQHGGTPALDAETFGDELAMDESFNDEMKDIEVAPNDLSIQRTQAEVDAVRFIQAWYRRQLVIASVSKTGASEARSRIHANCQAEVDKFQISRPYRHMFLGPLPHVLAALEGCKQTITQAKKAAVKRMLRPGHMHLDETNERITQCM